MANIRIDLEATVVNGQALTFKSPADCSQVTGLIIYYPVGDTTTSKEFKFVDAHGVDVGSGTISLFAENVLVKVVLDIDQGKAYVQNADTNAYLEGRFLTDADGIMQKMMQMQSGDTNTGIEDGNGVKTFGYGTDGKFHVGDSTFPLALFGSGNVPTYNGVNMPQVQTGSYKGTGKYGSSNKNSLTFNFLPQIVFIFSSNNSNIVTTMVAAPGSTIGQVITNSASDDPDGYNYVTWSGNKMSWYGDDSYGIAQMNRSGQAYKWIAFG